MDELFDDDAFCDEPNHQGDAVESGEGAQRQILAPKYSHLTPESLFPQEHPAFEILDISPEEFLERYARYETQHYDYAAFRGKCNPYTGERILSETLYAQYLREHFFFQLCSLHLERSLSTISKAAQQNLADSESLEALRRDLYQNVERFLAEQEAFTDEQASLYKELTKKDDEVAYWEDYAKDLFDEVSEKEAELNSSLTERAALQSELLRAQDLITPRKRFFRVLPLLFCVAFVTFLLTFYLGKPSWYDSGYQAGKQEAEESAYASGYEDGKSAGAEAGSYSAGYGDGKAIGEEQGYSRGYAAGQRASASSFSADTGTGAARQSAIASGYIGNIGTGKFHTSSCSYLPNQENQIVFSSYDEAVAAGYSPCGHCL